MSALLDQLQHDHRNLVRLLNFLDDAIGSYADEDSEPPDLPRILDALEYIQAYPEAFHHPLEDIAYEHLADRVEDPELTQVLANIAEQHRQLRTMTKELRAKFNTVAQDQVVPLEELLGTYRKYSHLQRDHLHTENGYLFPLIEEKLSVAEQREIMAEFAAQEDPLFGAGRKAQFDDLFEAVTSRDDDTPSA